MDLLQAYTDYLDNKDFFMNNKPKKRTTPNEYELTYPDGTIETTKNLVEFCETKGFKVKSVYSAISNNTTYQGIKIRNLNEPELSFEKYLKREFGLTKEDVISMYGVDGYIAQREEYKLREKPTISIKKTRYKHKGNYIVTFPDGHEEQIINLKQFCIKHNLSFGNMGSVLSGKRQNHKGFKVRYA